MGLNSAGDVGRCKIGVGTPIANKVGQLHKAVVYDRQVTDSCRCQGQRGITAQPSNAGNDDAGALQLDLPLMSETGDLYLASIPDRFSFI